MEIINSAEKALSIEKKLWFWVLFLFCITSLLSGCSSENISANKIPANKITTQKQARAVDKICYEQAIENRKNRAPNTYSLWIKCKKENFMALTIKQNPGKKDEVTAMYDELLRNAALVDRGEMSLESFYKRWDERMNAMRMIGRCKIKIVGSGNEGRCLDAGSDILIENVKE